MSIISPTQQSNKDGLSAPSPPGFEIFGADLMLGRQLLDAILRSQDRLMANGFVDQETFKKNFADTIAPGLSAHAVTAFGRQEPALDEIPSEAYQFSLRLLQSLEGLLPGRSVASPNTAPDWETDRDGSEACNRLGIRSFEALQDLIATKYGTSNSSMTHLHKGPGEGSLTRRLRSSPPSPNNIQWQHIGIGCEIPFSIERVLARFIRPDHEFSPEAFHEFFRLLGLGLRRRLKPEWFEAADSKMMTWRQKTQLCDLNLLYGILKNPNDLWPWFKLSEDLHSVTVAIEFPEDTKSPVIDEVRALFEEYRRDAMGVLRKIFTEEFMRGVEADSAVLKRLFMENVARYRKNPHDERPADAPWDLNGLAHVYPRDMILGFFDKIRADGEDRSHDLIPEESVHLITSIRGDSHEDAETFKKDIENNLKLLRPGGVLLVDGIRSSYARDYRYEEIREIMQKPEYQSEFNAEAVLDSGPRPLAVLIQRMHPNGYFTDDEKRAVFKEDVYFSSLEDIIARPDIAVLDNVRHLISDIAGGHVDIFRGLHQHSHEGLERLLYAEALDVLRTKLITDHAIIALAQRLGAHGVQPQTAQKYIRTAYNDERRTQKLRRRGAGAPTSDVSTPQTQGLRSAILGLIRGRETTTRILTSDSICKITNQLAAELRVHVAQSEFAQHPFDEKLGPLQPGRIYTLPCKGSRQNPTNTVNLPRAVRSPREDSSLRERAVYLNEAIPRHQPALIQALDELLRRIQRKRDQRKNISHAHRPLCLIVPDCVTNDCLVERYREFLGEEAFGRLVQVIPIRFCRDSCSTVGIERQVEINKYLMDALDLGSHFFHFGGGFENPDSPEGIFLRTQIYGPILDGIGNPDRHDPCCFSATCLGHELAVDFAGSALRLSDLQFHNLHPVQSVQGALIPGNCPVDLLPARPGDVPSPLQRLVRLILPPRFSGFGLNSFHTLVELPKGKGFLAIQLRQLLDPFAISGVTGLPVGCTYYENLGGRGISTNFHPEIRQEDIPTILAALQEIQSAINSTFGPHAMDVLRHNLLQDPPLPDFGTPFLFFTLLHFACELATGTAPELTDLEPYNPPASPHRRRGNGNRSRRKRHHSHPS